MTDRMNEIKEIIMPTIWNTWCVNDISWTEIFDYLKNSFTNDVISDLGLITQEKINKQELVIK